MRSLSHEIIDINRIRFVTHLALHTCGLSLRFRLRLLVRSWLVQSPTTECFSRSPVPKRATRKCLTFPKKGKVQKGRTQTKRPSANAEGLPCFNTCAYLAPDGGVFSSGSLAASDPTYLMVLRGVSIVMIASPVAVKRLMPNV